MESRQRYRLTKVSNNPFQRENMLNPVTGKLVFELHVGKPLMLRMDNYKFRVTSTILKIVPHDGYREVVTENSVYKLEPIEKE